LFAPGNDAERGVQVMKIYALLMLIGVILSFSYIPVRRPKPAVPPPEPAPAKA
jgi:hypothetical protein